MYAVIKSGGKQYRVEKGQKLKLEKLAGEPGSPVELDQVLMLSDGDQVQLGSPVLAGHKVKATVLAHGRHKKVEIIKFRRRKHHQKRRGHRQDFTEVEITEIA